MRCHRHAKVSRMVCRPTCVSGLKVGDHQAHRKLCGPAEPATRPVEPSRNYAGIRAELKRHVR